MGQLINISQNRFLIETGCHLTLGLICAKAGQDLSWTTTGLLLGSVNGCSLKLADYFGNSPALNDWSKFVLKCMALSGVLFVTAQVTSRIKATAAMASASLSLITDFAISTFSLSSPQTRPPLSSAHVSHSKSQGPLTIKNFYHTGTLKLSSSTTFSGTQSLVEGLACWVVGTTFDSGMGKESEDAYFYVHFPHTQLARTDGTFLEPPTIPTNEQNFVVMECLKYDTVKDVQAKIQVAVQSFLDHQGQLPKKLILPIGGTAHAGGIGHTACLVVEPDGNNFNVTGLDSLSSSSSFGWREAAKGIQQGLQTHFPSSSVRIIGNNWSQNNAMKCGVHVLKNTLFAAGYSGSLFNLVTQVNSGGTPPTELAARTNEELSKSIAVMKREVFPVFGQVYEMNPGKLFMQTNRGTLPLRFGADFFKLSSD